jgi:hypothetical protein
MSGNEDCARKVALYIKDRLAKGNKYGDLKIQTLCGQNIFEALLYGHQPISEEIVLDLVKERMPSSTVIVKTADKIYYGPHWRIG